MVSSLYMIHNSVESLGLPNTKKPVHWDCIHTELAPEKKKKKTKSCGASWWRVCYQRGLPRPMTCDR